MKKTLLITLICTIFLTFTACSTTENETKPSTDIDINADDDSTSDLESDDEAITDDETIADTETDEESDSGTNADDDSTSDLESDDDAITDDETITDTETDEETDGGTNDDDAITDDETIADPETDEDPDSDTNNDNSLESLIDTIYAATGLELPMLMKSPLTKENQAYMLGVDNFDFIEGFVSEPMISAQAHSVVLFVVEEGSDIEAIKEDIRANADGYKWICVGVEPENIIVDSKDNVIILIMDDNASTIHEAFLTTVN